VKLYHGTNYSSAIDIVNNGICLKYSKLFLDFGAGFYTTPSYDHAAIAAIRATQKYNVKNRTNEEPYIVEVDFRQISGVELSIGAFPRHSEKWGWFVLNNRLTPDILSTYNIVEHNQDGKYDVCYGEIADGNIANIAYEVNNGLLELKKVKYNSFLKNNGEVYPQQYSFHTLKAISCIKVLSCDTIKNKRKYLKRLGRR
jgi:hypothetical protein